jgi:NRAMP (natural resistance-associated macrophage protein)-like metal ion transporter
MARDHAKRLTKQNLLLLLSVLGPGIIVSMVDNDAGGIATYSVSGARYGYSILWILVPTALLLFMVQEMNARMGVVTGKGLAALIREEFSFRLTALIMIAMIVANFANTVSDFAGIAASGEIFHIPFYVAVPVSRSVSCTSRT